MTSNACVGCPSPHCPYWIEYHLKAYVTLVMTYPRYSVLCLKPSQRAAQQFRHSRLSMASTGQRECTERWRRKDLVMLGGMGVVRRRVLVSVLPIQPWSLSPLCNPIWRGINGPWSILLLSRTNSLCRYLAHEVLQTHDEGLIPALGPGSQPDRDWGWDGGGGRVLFRAVSLCSAVLSWSRCSVTAAVWQHIARWLCDKPKISLALSQALNTPLKRFILLSKNERELGTRKVFSF